LICFLVFSIKKNQSVISINELIFYMMISTEHENNQFVLKINQMILTECCYDFQIVF